MVQFITELQRGSISCTLYMMFDAAAEISFGSAGLWWGMWCGTALSLLTAHLSHFVSDSIHFHGPISSHVAGGWCDNMFMFVLKPRIYTNICSMPNRKAVIFYTWLDCLFSPFIWANVYHVASASYHASQHMTEQHLTSLILVMDSGYV